MFIQRDYRKIEVILNDKAVSKSALKFSNRKEEFNGKIKPICRETYISTLSECKSINLYGNDISDLQGLGILSQIQLEAFNLGNNKISSLPLEFGTLSTLRSLFLEDNQIDSFPIAICQLHNLVELRLSGNNLKTLTTSMRGLENLEIMALDNNEIESFPTVLYELPALKQLFLRQNKIKELPVDIEKMETLQILSISSNLIEILPDSICHMTNLQKLYANGNKISMVPDNLPYSTSLQILNLSNNNITTLPTTWISLWGKVDNVTGTLITEKSDTNIETSSKNIHMTKVTLLGNPLTQ